MSQVSVCKKEELQLVGVTAMFIASKYEEIYHPKVSMNYFQITRLICVSECLSKYGIDFPKLLITKLVMKVHNTTYNPPIILPLTQNIPPTIITHLPI